MKEKPGTEIVSNLFLVSVQCFQECSRRNIDSYYSVAVVSDSLQPPGLQHARLPRPLPPYRACSYSCPLSRWCHPTISSSVACVSCPESFPASGSFPVSQVFTSDGQIIGASVLASVLLKNIQGWFPLELTGLISLQSKGFSRVFSSTTVWKESIFWHSAYPLTLSSVHDHWKNHSFDWTDLCWQSDVSAFWYAI